MCCGSWGLKELDTTERLKWTELNYIANCVTWVVRLTLLVLGTCSQNGTHSYAGDLLYSISLLFIYMLILIAVCKPFKLRMTWSDLCHFACHWWKDWGGSGKIGRVAGSVSESFCKVPGAHWVHSKLGLPFPSLLWLRHALQFPKHLQFIICFDLHNSPGRWVFSLGLTPAVIEDYRANNFPKVL